jgi:hypothetical protein
MMTLEWIDLRCPVCESVFESMAASASDEAGHDYYIDPSYTSEHRGRRAAVSCARGSSAPGGCHDGAASRA